MDRCNTCNAQLHHREGRISPEHLFINSSNQVGFSTHCLSLNLFDEGWRPGPEVSMNDLVESES